MLLAYEPTGELALPSPAGVRLLGIEAVRRPRWPAMRHVFDIGHDAGLHVEVDHHGEVRAFGVAYDVDAFEEILTAL
jgi:hypothetical protein